MAKMFIMRRYKNSKKAYYARVYQAFQQSFLKTLTSENFGAVKGRKQCGISANASQSGLMLFDGISHFRSRKKRP